MIQLDETIAIDTTDFNLFSQAPPSLAVVNHDAGFVMVRDGSIIAISKRLRVRSKKY